uniref:GTPase Era, mitochondrial n=1 Tax=Timema tahoe TaxID=61484 RepID=A0A7R9FK94_9NEOP|nr:unnamed protein product [Timema tahoe]
MTGRSRFEARSVGKKERVGRKGVWGRVGEQGVSLGIHPIEAGSRYFPKRVVKRTQTPASVASCNENLYRDSSRQHGSKQLANALVVLSSTAEDGEIKVQILVRSHNLIRSESRQIPQTIPSFRNVSTSSIYQEEYETYVVHSETRPENPHLVKVAIIGLPNAGKSTLINSLTGRKACPISSKVHTTRCRARAISVKDNTQIVFLDTPGLVTEEESKHHHLEPQYLRDGEKALQEAHVIGVVHDASNYWLKNRLDEKVLRLLHLYPHKDSFLILNKIDILKSKRNLLDLVKILTNGSLVGQQPPEPGGNKKLNYLSESQVKKAVKPERGWPNFREVFLVSALTRSGVDGIERFLLKSSRPGPWMFSEEQFSDQSPEWLIEETVRGRLLEHLPQEIPYNLNTRIEYFHRGEQGNLVSVVLVECATPRLQKLVVGPKGSRIRTIAMEAEQDLYHTFQQPTKYYESGVQQAGTIDCRMRHNQYRIVP